MYKTTSAMVLISLATVLRAEDPPLTVYDRALRVRYSGADLSSKDREECSKAFAQYYEELSKKHGTRTNFKFPEPDRSEFYITAVKMAIIDEQAHAGWPFRSTLRFCVLDGLKAKIDAKDDPFIRFCTIFPALGAGQKKYAAEAFLQLRETDPFLANLTVTWSMQYYPDPAWMVTYYMAQDQHGKAMEAADMVAATGLLLGYETKAHLLERLAKYTEAEACYKEIEKRYAYVGPLVGFYLKYADKADDSGTSFRQHYSQLKDRCFPHGMRKVDEGSLDGPPEAGVVFMDENAMTRKLGIRRGTVLVALDGYRVESMPQYFLVRELDASNPRMRIMLWNGNAYSTVTAEVNERRFGVVMEGYKR